MNDDGNVAAVLDFGFFSTVRAPAFDAAVAADIFDMYGPGKSTSCAAMEKLMRGTFGYPQEVLAVYLAAYAMATMTMFGSSEATRTFTGAPGCCDARTCWADSTRAVTG